MMHYRRRQYDKCSAACTELLQIQPRDQAAVFFKCRSLSARNWTDDTELEDEGLADLMLDDNAVDSMPRYEECALPKLLVLTSHRPGTSVMRPATAATVNAADQCVRPVSTFGRPLTGFAKPGSACRPITGQTGVLLALRNTATATGQGRPVTTLGREVRLGTASVAAQPGGGFLNIERLEFTRLVRRTAMAKAICDYLIYHERNVTRALELCAEATKEACFKDWWWKCRLAKCYYRLGLYRDSERQLLSSLRDQNMTTTVLELAKVYLRLDQPNTALKALQKAVEEAPTEPRLQLGIARIHEMMYALGPSVVFYQRVLMLDASNVEGLACLAANYFYSHQPELSLRYYRRLLQMGVSGPEIWNNLGLCCFYSSQFDLALGCFDRALQLADDTADVWYNIGHVGIGIGDIDMAYQSFKISLSLDRGHAESLCNLGILELQKSRIESAQAIFLNAQETAPHLFQPYFNGALLAYKLGNFQGAFAMVSKALEINQGHNSSAELQKILARHFQVL